MSISNAMQTGVSGLLANSSAVSNISTNIANANTDGYKSSFAQMVTSASTTGSDGPAGVRAVSTSNITLDGALRTTGADSDLAISGNGFFVVSRNPNETVSTNYSFTRAGAFTKDENGNLKNAAGLYLSGFPYGTDGTLGTVDRSQFNDLETVNVGAMMINGEATTEMSINGNLPAQSTGASSTLEPLVTSQKYYTPLGGEERVEFTWTPTATPNVWQLALSAEGADLGSVDVTFSDSTNAGLPLSYGNITSVATAPAAFAFDAATGVATLTLDNATTPQTLTLNIGAPGTAEGITQFAGDYSPVNAELDGFGTGTLVSFEIDEKGDLYGVFNNSARHLLYNIPLAVVPNPDGLRMIDGNAYIMSQDSGDFQLAPAGSAAAGTISTGSLEGSNVELAEELTQLIRTQRAYSSNAKIITTVDEMMDETTRLKR